MRPVPRQLIAAVVALLAILFLWGILRIRIAAWLLLPWFVLTFAYLVLPRTEPEPRHPVRATAIVDTVTTITTVGGTNEDRDIPLPHPYQIVRLKYLPAGMETPVVGIDKIDTGSVPNLNPGQNFSIVYDSEHPRVARLQGGAHTFPGQARAIVVLVCAGFVVLLLALTVIRGLFRLPGRLLRRL